MNKPKRKTEKNTKVYVMRFGDMVRVGLTKQTIHAREGSARRNTNQRWTIVGHTKQCTKLEAAAIEAVAHFLLSDKEEQLQPVPTSPRTSIMQIFKCTQKVAENAIEKAASSLKINAGWIAPPQKTKM